MDLYSASFGVPMTPILTILAGAFFFLAVVWPLSHFGYRFYLQLVEAEEKKHAAHGGH
jgi:hypothetical protein